MAALTVPAYYRKPAAVSGQLSVSGGWNHIKQTAHPLIAFPSVFTSERGLFVVKAAED
jgi:hypothetical protein